MCYGCLLAVNNILHEEPTDSVRCFLCGNSDEFIVEYSNGAELLYSAGPKDDLGGRVYSVISVNGTFDTKAKFKAVCCADCDHPIPDWAVEENRYVRLSRTQTDS